MVPEDGNDDGENWRGLEGHMSDDSRLGYILGYSHIIGAAFFSLCCEPKRASFDLSRPLARPWLYGIAANLLLKHRRTEARRLSAMAKSDADRGFDAHGSREETDRLNARVLLPKLVRWIDVLPDGEREALLLFAWEDLGYADIAAALDIPVGTVRSRLNRARGRLRELIDGCGEQRIEPLVSDDSKEPVGNRR